jgi:hypothetical protein
MLHVPKQLYPLLVTQATVFAKHMKLFWLRIFPPLFKRGPVPSGLAIRPVCPVLPVFYFSQKDMRSTK